MALYLGSSEKLKVGLDGTIRCINLVIATKPSSDKDRLLSLDNYILMDMNGLYLISKESE